MQAFVKSLNVSDKKGVVKIPVSSIIVRENHGIEGDAHSGPWHRQISLLAQESVDKVPLDFLKPGIFGENITTQGIELCTLPIGTQLSIAQTVLEVTQIGKECHTGCAIKEITGDCVMPREGIFCKVIKGGEIKTGAEIKIVK